MLKVESYYFDAKSLARLSRRNQAKTDRRGSVRVVGRFTRYDKFES